MRPTRRVRAALAVLAVPAGWAQELSRTASGAGGHCEAPEAPTLAREQSLLQGRAALHVTRMDDAEFREDLKKHDKAARRRHLSAVLEQASGLVRRGASAEDLAAAGDQMEAIDEKVLAAIQAEHKQASMLLNLQWNVYEVAGSFVDQEAQSVEEYSRVARKQDEVHRSCRAQQGGLVRAAHKCEKELRALAETETMEHSVLNSAIGEEGRLGDREAELGAVANHEAVQRQHSKMDARLAKARHESSQAQRLRITKESQCNLLNAERGMVAVQCSGNQRASEQEWCVVQSAVGEAHGRLADSYAMALSGYEAAASRAQVEEAARKAEFGVVEAVRCLKDRFLAAKKGSIADAAWLDQCQAAGSDNSGLDMTYEEPRTTAAAAIALAPEQTPCSPAFLRARDSVLPEGVVAAPCTPCVVPSKPPAPAGSPGHAGQSDRFWTGFHKGVRVASGREKTDASHVERLQKKIGEEGAENNLARFQDSFAQKVLDRLPSEWAGSMDQELHHGFMNGLEVGVDLDVSEAEKRQRAVDAEDGEGRVAGYLARAAKALARATQKVEAAFPQDTRVKVSSGFEKASESAHVLPASES